MTLALSSRSESQTSTSGTSSFLSTRGSKRPMRKSDFKVLSEVAGGSFGKVYTVTPKTHRRSFFRNKEVYALKEVDMSNFSLREESNAIREVTLMQSFNHPYILNFIESFVTPEKTLCILMDFAEMGSLSNLIKTTKRNQQTLPVRQALVWLAQLALAISYLHNLKIIHRDIKTQNILLMKCGKVVLADFGVSRVLDNTAALATTMVGTPFSMAPEMYKGKPYSTKSDVWSFGIVLYEMCTLQTPFFGKTLAEVRSKVLHEPEPELIPPFHCLSRIYHGALEKSARRRYDIDKILQHPVIVKVLKELYNSRKSKATS